MTDQVPEAFMELLESLAEGTLSDDGRARLLEMLRERPEWVEVVRTQFAMSRALEDWGKPDQGRVERTVSHVTRVAAEDEFAFVRAFRRRLARRRWTRRLAVAALLALSALVFVRLPRGQADASVAVLHLTNPDGGVVASRGIPRGGVLEESSGLMRLDFRSGAVLAIEAPVRLTVVSPLEVLLHRGRVNAWCPESAHGFKVRTRNAAATDLGTSFGVSAGENGEADFLVLDGLIEVENREEKIRLPEGKALSSDLQGGLKSVEFKPSGFRKTWSLAHGILSTKGALIPAEPDIPERLAALENNDHVLVIPEKRDVAFDRPIRADVIRPGMMPGNIDGRPQIVPANPSKRLSAFLLRYNPVGTIPEEEFLRFEGEVTFDRPVIALQCQSEYLTRGEQRFSIGHWEGDYPGIELTQIHNPPDSVTLSEDRRTVKVVFYAGRYTDAIRVIVEDQ